MRTFAFFSLWNPHNIKLEAATYRIKFKADGQIFVVETTDEASGDEPILYHSNEEPSGNVALSGWSYQQNTRSIISPRSSTGDIVQDLEFTFESAPLRFSPGEILQIGLDLDNDTTHTPGNSYRMSSSGYFTFDPADLNASAIIWNLPFADLDFDTYDVYSVFWNRKAVSGTYAPKMSLELSLGNGELLQRIEGINMDKGTYSAHATDKGYRTVGSHEQVSDPRDHHPIGPELALRDTHYRIRNSRPDLAPFANYNPRATFSSGAYDSPTYFNPSGSGLNSTWIDSGTTNWTPGDFSIPSNDGNNTPASWGTTQKINHTFSNESAYPIPSRIIAFDVPRTPPISLGAFQHAELTPVNHFSANPLGNALSLHYGQKNYPDRIESTLGGLNQVDLSYMLNDVIWDQYFLSTIPSDQNMDAYPIYENLSSFDLAQLKQQSLANPRIRFQDSTNIPASEIEDVRSISGAAFY